MAKIKHKVSLGCRIIIIIWVYLDVQLSHINVMTKQRTEHLKLVSL